MANMALFVETYVFVKVSTVGAIVQPGAAPGIAQLVFVLRPV